jgi:hypothetical protein
MRSFPREEEEVVVVKGAYICSSAEMSPAPSNLRVVNPLAYLSILVPNNLHPFLPTLPRIVSDGTRKRVLESSSK